MMNINMKKIGAACRNVRIDHGFTIKDISELTGYTVANISAFEKGKIRSLPLFLYYRSLGLEISLKEVLINGEK